MSKIDFVFLDGGHAYDTVKNDLNCCLEVVNLNGTIFCDDYNLGGTWFYSGGKNLGSCGCVHNPEKPLEVGEFKYNMSAIVQNGVKTNEPRNLPCLR